MVSYLCYHFRFWFRNLPRNAKNIPIAEKYCKYGSSCWKMRQSDAKALTTSSTVFSKFQITFQFNFVLKGLKAKIFTICIMMSNKVVIARAISFVHTRVSTVESPLHRENVTFRSFLIHTDRGSGEKVQWGWSHYNTMIHI